MNSNRGERHLVTAAESQTGDMETSPSRAGTPVTNGNEHPRNAGTEQQMTPVSSRYSALRQRESDETFECAQPITCQFPCCGCGIPEREPLRQREPRQENAQHLRDMRALPCLICNDDSGCDPAHIRYTAPGKFNAGGQKPHDWFVVPLCRKHHDEQHRKHGEREWWRKKGINPLPI